MVRATDTPHGQFLAQPRFGSLDGLRALSVIAVIWQHTVGGKLHPAMAHLGNEGVTVFFAISGFLITTLLIREQRRHGTVDFKAFYLRRSLRIFPLYYTVLLLYVLLVWAFERDSRAAEGFFHNLPYYATYTANLFVAMDGRVIFYFAWSLAAEEQYYAVWPPLLRWLRGRGRALGLLLVLMLMLVGTELLLRQQPEAARAAWLNRFYVVFPTAILAGSAAALALDSPRGFSVLWKWFGASPWHAWAWLALALALTLDGRTPGTVLHLLWSAVVLACVVREDHAFARGLHWGPLQYLGTISYGAYLLHMVCYHGYARVVAQLGLSSPPLLTFVATVALTAVLAGLSFRHFEARFLRLKDRYAR